MRAVLVVAVMLAGCPSRTEQAPVQQETMRSTAPVYPPSDMAKSSEQIASETVRAAHARLYKTMLVGRGLADDVIAKEDAQGPTLYVHSERCNQKFVEAFAIGIAAKIRGSGFRRVTCQGGDSWMPREAVFQ